MNDVKSLFASRTLWGVVISIIPTVLGLFHYHITDAAAFASGAQDVVDTVITLSGAVLAAYGRIKATAALVVKNPTP